MNYLSIIKKQSFIVTISIIVMAIILLGTSYALFTNQNNSNTHVVSSGTLVVNYEGTTITTTGGTDGGGNLLEIEPLDEGTVDTMTPYKIVINNTGTLAMKYNIVLYTDSSNTLEHNYYALKYKNNGSYTSKAALSTLPKVDSTVTQLNSIKYKLTDVPFVVQPGASVTQEIYVWIDEDYADANISNKIASLKIAVEGEATDSRYSVISGDLDTVGSIVRIDTEDFYVIGQEDASHVKLLSKYNLEVGESFTNPSNKQNSSVTGWLPNTEGPYIGVVEYSSTNYWTDGTTLKSQYGSGYPAFVYDDNASIKTYVDNYVTYLNDQGASVTGRLIKLEELIALGCNTSTNHCDSQNSGTAPEWVYAMSYKTGTANTNTYTISIRADGYYGNNTYNEGIYFGVRPVIILQK